MHSEQDDCTDENVCAPHASDPLALQHEIDRLNYGLAALRAWVWETDELHRFSYMSASVELVARKKREWHYGKTRQEVGTLDPSRPEMRRYLEQLEKRQPFGPLEFPRQEGDRTFWMRTLGWPRYDDHGRFIGYRGVASDVSAEIMERQQRQAAVRALVEQKRALDEANSELRRRMDEEVEARLRLMEVCKMKADFVRAVVADVIEPLRKAKSNLSMASAEAPADPSAKALSDAMAEFDLALYRLNELIMVFNPSVGPGETASASGWAPNATPPPPAADSRVAG